jgi:hypothetical protein
MKDCSPHLLKAELDFRNLGSRRSRLQLRPFRSEKVDDDYHCGDRHCSKHARKVEPFLITPDSGE